MADCTKTAEFLREWKRLFDNTEIISLKDPKKPKEVLVYNQIMSDLEHPEQTIRYVQKWSDEHPVMTWKGKLRELLQNGPIAQLTDEYCPFQLFGDHAPCRDTCYAEGTDACDECWNGEYKEEP